MTQVNYRRAQLADVPALAGLGAKLARQHMAYDSLRFTCAEPAETGFHEFFTEQFTQPGTAITVAEIDREIVGYVFVRIEPGSLVDLLAPSAWIHDISIEESARGSGIGPALLSAATASARELGARSVMLTVSPKNDRARRTFEKHGFRSTMIEMRMEL